MLKNYCYYLLLIFGVLFLSACCKKRLYCDSGKLDIYFSGFQRAEINSIIIKRYKIGETDSAALDSGLFVYTGNTPQMPNKRDTLSLSDYTSNNGMSTRLIWGNDWKIQVPALQRTYTFKELTDVGNRVQLVKCEDDDTKCINEIGSYTVGGLPIGGKTLYIGR
jgi:hypothetical protein